MAEGLARKVLADAGVETVVRSAGTKAESKVSPEAVEAMLKYDVDISTHVPQELTRQLIRDAQVVLCMTQDLKAHVLEQAPDAGGKLLTLAEFIAPADDVIRDIADPAGQGVGAYERSADQLARLMEQLPSVLQAWLNARRGWCYFRCLVQAVYREIRHIGPPGDGEARCEVEGFLTQAGDRCRRNRRLLQSVELWNKGERATTTREVLEPYVSATALHLEQLPELFRLPQWADLYGGPRWAHIAEVALRMRRALDGEETRLLGELCDEAKSLQHNSGDLVPSLSEWGGFKRQKWPELCD